MLPSSALSRQSGVKGVTELPHLVTDVKDVLEVARACPAVLGTAYVGTRQRQAHHFRFRAIRVTGGSVGWHRRRSGSCLPSSRTVECLKQPRCPITSWERPLRARKAVICQNVDIS